MATLKPSLGCTPPPHGRGPRTCQPPGSLSAPHRPAQSDRIHRPQLLISPPPTQAPGSAISHVTGGGGGEETPNQRGLLAPSSAGESRESSPSPKPGKRGWLVDVIIRALTGDGAVHNGTKTSGRSETVGTQLRPARLTPSSPWPQPDASTPVGPRPPPDSDTILPLTLFLHLPPGLGPFSFYSTRHRPTSPFDGFPPPIPLSWQLSGQILGTTSALPPLWYPGGRGKLRALAAA